MFDGQWAVLNIPLKKVTESYKTKALALSRVSNLVEREGPYWGVIPISEERWKALRDEEQAKKD